MQYDTSKPKKSASELSPERRKLLEKLLHEKSSGPVRITPYRGTEAPLSFAQERQWILDRLQPDSSFYNVRYAWNLHGELNQSILLSSLNQVLERQSGLRMQIRETDGIPRQKPSAATLPIDSVDLSHLPESQQNKEVSGLLHNLLKAPFNLMQPPMIRCLLVKQRDSRHILLVVFHHIASDGWSRSVFARDLSALYNAALGGQPADLPALPIQYADYAVWQRQWLQGEVLEKQVRYWREQLAELPTLELPTSYPRPPQIDYHGEELLLSIPGPLLQSLKQLAQQNNCTLFMLLLSVFQVLLMRYSNQHDFAVGTPIAGRNRPELENLIGFFVNTLVLRADLSGNPSFTELLKRTRSHTLQAFTHQDLPFEKLVEELNPTRDLSRNPLFQIMFSLQNQPASTLALQDIQAEPLQLHDQTSKFDLSLSLTDTGTELVARVEYATSLFSHERIQQMLGHWQNLLETVVAAPGTPIGELPLLSEDEKHKILVDWNQTQRDYAKNATLHQLFEQQAQKTPEAVALVFENTQLTYAELNRKANQLAHLLLERGIKPGAAVVLCMNRSCEYVVTVLAVLKAGGIYVPLDPAMPTQRLHFMMSDVGASALLSHQGLGASLYSEDLLSLQLDTIHDNLERLPVTNPAVPTSAEDVAYIMFTSGSTGKPKGVEIPHRGVVRLVYGVEGVALEQRQTTLLLAPAGFDASTFELWGALLHGGKCVVYPSPSLNFDELGRVLVEQKVSVLWLTASLFNAVVDYKPALLSSVSCVLTGGEALSVTHVRKALAQLPKTRLFNGYGPTENTTFTTTYLIPPALDETTISIPLGRPLGNTQVYILEPTGAVAPVGVPGELYVGGDGLACGYRNRPELNTASFVPDPYAGNPDARMYKTGDRCQWLPDGNIEFLGRFDSQVKIRGFRIEPGEIETVLSRDSDISMCVVVIHGKGSNQQIVAYVVPAAGRHLSSENLSAKLAMTLPAYMIPNQFVLLDALPFNANGKIDRKALPEPQLQNQSCDFVAPRTDMEIALASIWKQVLSVKDIGVHDNFFNLGGHSLLAIELLHHQKDLLDIDVPVTCLFENPTISGLIKSIEDNDYQSIISTPLEKIQPAGNNTPVFYIGSTNNARKLAPLLGNEQPVYGLNIFGVKEAVQPELPVTILTIARQFLDEIKRVQPTGPYQFVSYCGDAPIAYEIAQALSREKETISLFMTVDTVWLQTKEGEKSSVVKLLDNSRTLTPSLLAKKIVYRTASLAHGISERVTQIIKTGSFRRLSDSPTVVKHKQFYKKFQMVQKNYIPDESYNGKMVSLLSREALLKFSASGLEKYIEDPNDFSEHIIDTFHDLLFEEPHVQELAMLLKQYLK